MIWATVSFQSCFWCFCFWCRASPSSTAKNVISLIPVLTIWWHPCVESFLAGRGCLPWPVRSLGKTLLAFPCLIFYSKAKLVCYFRYLLTPYFCIPVHTYCCKWQNFILFYDCTVFRCIYVSHLYPFICWWTLRLFSYLSFVNSSPMNIGVHVSFQMSVFQYFWIYTQKWNCQII